MIGEWHKRMQNLFPNDWLEKYSSNRNNRADVLNEQHKLVLEVQNSYCQNCEEKTNAWKDNGYNVIWLFNGKHAEVDPCLDLGMCQKIITITEKISKLVVFIYVDDEHVYPIQTSSFRKYTSKVEPISMNLFVSKFIDGTVQNIVPNIEKITVYIRQDPPGSGKTFSMTRKAIDNTEYKTVIILCQHHSPNAVIKQQIQQHTGWECEEYNKAFKFKQDERIILIATMDSLMHTLSQGNCENSRDQFSGKAKYVSNNGCRLTPLGNCTLKNETIRFCCKTWIIVDEATKTPSDGYMSALYELITETGSDLHICGDVLQSTNEGENLMKNCKTYFKDVNLVLEEGNEVRRFGVAGTDLLNRLIPYEMLGVQRPIPHPYAPTDTDIFCHKYDVNNFLHHLKNDIHELGLKPNDIIVVCVPTYDEKFLDLHEKINNLFCVDETQSGWNAYLHKSEEGKPVDLSLSENSVRMVSIHTSQGDGRKLVYVVGISRYNIEKYVRDDPDHNIKYWSFVNVALSRMKRRMRIFIDKFDSLTENFKHLFNDKDDKIKLHNETKLNNVTIRSSETHEYCNLETLQDVRNQNILQTVTNRRTNQTEWSDHVFCRAVFYYKIMEFLNEKERFTNKIYKMFSKNISDKFSDRYNYIYIPKFKSKIETYKNIINMIEQIKRNKTFEQTVECVSVLTYVMTENMLEPFKLYEIFEKRDVLIEMIEPVMNITNKYFRKIYEIIGDDDIEYQNISHPFVFDSDDIHIITHVPIIILTTTKTYCVYPVYSMDRIYTDNVIVQSYVDSIILSNCERDETSVPQEFEMNKKCVKSYLYSITCGTFQEITPQCNDTCKELLKSHIYNKYERFFDKLYDMYDTDYSILTSKKDSLTETWIKDIIGASVVDAEDDDRWDKERFLKKLNNKLTRVISAFF